MSIKEQDHMPRWGT